jgi:hypothetical protein
LGFKTWFEGRIKTMPETMVINATEGGAKIHGAVQIPFESVCQEITASNLGSFPKNPAKPWQLDYDYLKKYVNELQKLCQEISIIEKELIEGITLIKEIKKAPKKSVIRRIEKINLFFTDGSRKVQTVIEMMGQSALMDTEQVVLDKNLDRLSIGEIYKTYLVIYQSALPGLERSQNFISKVIELISGVLELGSVSSDILIKNNLNKWLPDGQKKIYNF